MAATTAPSRTALIAATEAHVRAELAGRDGSHDYAHIARVRALAVQLGAREGLGNDALFEVELAALLHDIRDWKYSSQQGGEAAGDAIAAFLSTQSQPPDLIARIVAIVDAVGFKDELASSAGGDSTASRSISREAAVVQDADRLDAIGAIGIARCFTFGGAKHRVLHDPAVPPRVNLTKEAYMAGGQSTTINHFYEKLLTLKDRMKTASGRELAQQRHNFMHAFLQQFEAEWNGAA